MQNHIANQHDESTAVSPLALAAVVIGLSACAGLVQVALQPAWLLSFGSTSVGAALLALVFGRVSLGVGAVLLGVVNAAAMLLLVQPSLLSHRGWRRER